eukprot:g39229.t1
MQSFEQLGQNVGFQSEGGPEMGRPGNWESSSCKADTSTSLNDFWSVRNGRGSKELFGLDTLHKSMWIKLLEEMFLGMPSEFPWGDEIMLFLNVFNGALILHPEDSALLRQYAATAINTAVHFNHLFSLSGYQWILPSMLQ